MVEPARQEGRRTVWGQTHDSDQGYVVSPEKNCDVRQGYSNQNNCDVRSVTFCSPGSRHSGSTSHRTHQRRSIDTNLIWIQPWPPRDDTQHHVPMHSPVIRMPQKPGGRAWLT